MNSPITAFDPTGHFCVGPHCPETTPTPLYNAVAPPDFGNPLPGLDPLLPDNDYNNWVSGNYSGCFLCHAAVANGKTALTNEELSVIRERVERLMAIGYTPLMAFTLVFGIAEIAPTIIQAIIAPDLLKLVS